MNTGSPDAPTEEAVREYLREFLMDPHVIDLPLPLRYALVHWAILPKRPAESAKAYKSVWDGGTTSSLSADIEDNVPPNCRISGSPLIHYCASLTEQLAAKLDDPVELCTAYRSPSAAAAIDKLLAQGVDEICLLPLFPQSAGATVGSCTAAVKKALNGRAVLRVVPPFYNRPEYIGPLADSLKDAQEHILFSYHGLPLRQLKKQPAPDYRVQCLETTRLTAEAAGLSAARCSVSFQSRLGRAAWIEPYTGQVLAELPKRGITELAVICPAFFCDCLETLEEIAVRGKETFLSAGGGSFRMIPCLNDSPAAVRCLESLTANVESWTQIID